MHVVLAVVGGTPARVQCRSCNSQRNYRSARKSKAQKKEEATPARRTGTTDARLYNQLLKENFEKTPKQYRADQPFEKGDVVQHVNFGKGVVTKLIFPDRMEVVFQDESRVLVRSAQS